MAKEKFDFIQPLKDIPRTLKGFPKNLVRMWKEPVNNSAEVAARKKDIFPYLYIFSIIALLFLIVSVAIPDTQSVMMILVMIPGFGIIYCIFLLSILKKAQEKFTDLECPNCKAQIGYDSNVQIEVVDRKFTVSTKSTTIEQNGIPVQATVVASGKESTTAKITCKCQKCGTEKIFNHSFVTVECEKSGVKVPYVQSGAILVQYEQDVRDEGAEGFEGKSGTTTRGVRLKYNRSIQSLVCGYFGKEIQMR